MQSPFISVMDKYLEEKYNHDFVWHSRWSRNGDLYKFKLFSRIFILKNIIEMSCGRRNHMALQYMRVIPFVHILYFNKYYS